jgi:hypothetical protein
MIRGVPISPGVAVARAFRMDPALARHSPNLLDAAALSAEVARFIRHAKPSPLKWTDN